MIQQHANPEDFDLYALGALDGKEKQVLEEHLSGCAACRQQLAKVRSRVSLLGLSAPPVAPASNVKAALLERVHAEASMQPETAPSRPPSKRWGLRFSLAFAATTVILAFATYWLVRDDRQQHHDIQQLQAQLQSAQAEIQRDAANLSAFNAVIAQPDTLSVTLQQQAGGPQGQAHVLYNQRIGMAVYSGQISPTPAGKSYQLWLIPTSGAPISGGVVDANQQNGAVIVHLQQGLVPKAFAVTLEPEGGRPQPTGPKVLVGVVNG